MDQEYSCRIKQILEEGRRCKERLGVMGPTGPTGPTARCNKSSIYIFKW